MSRSVLPSAVFERIVVAEKVKEEKNCDKDDRIARKHQATGSPLDLQTQRYIQTDREI